MIAIQTPYQQFFDLDGSPLNSGSIYVGLPNQNPETSPLTVYWDEAGTQPVAQPIKTMNGYMVRNGTPAVIYSNVDYSIYVKNRRGILVYYSESASGFKWAENVEKSAAKTVGTIAELRALSKTGNPRALVIGYHVPGDGGGGQYYLDVSDTTTPDNGGTVIVASDGGRWKLPQLKRISVKQFGARGDFNGTTGTDDTAAIQAAINYAQANTNTGVYGSFSPSAGPGVVFFPQGAYRVTAPLLVSYKISMEGEGQTEFTYGSRIYQTSANTDLIKYDPTTGGGTFSVEKLVLSTTAGAGTGHLINVTRTAAPYINSQRYVNCTFAQPQNTSLMLTGDDIHIEGCLFDVSQKSGRGIQLGTTAPGGWTSNVKILGCDFFYLTQSAVIIQNCSGLVMSGCVLSQPNSTTKTPYLIDAITTDPYDVSNITITGNTVRGARTFFGAKNAANVTISGNTITESGAGAGETMNLFRLSGQIVNLNITGNAIRGSYDNSSFYNDSAATNVTGCISSNTFTNDGGSGDALNCTKFTGRILSNHFAGFTNRQIGEKRSTTGAPISPGTLTTGASYGYSFPVSCATYGDSVTVGTISNAWLAQTGIDVRSFVNAPGSARIEYRNTTTGTISIPAHDAWVEVTR